MIPKNIYKALEEITEACESFKEYDKCNSVDCPMHNCCIEEETFADFAYNTPKSVLEEFLSKAEKLTVELTKEDWEAEEANVRRCDPDYM